jgi:hypothetical protein
MFESFHQGRFTGFILSGLIDEFGNMMFVFGEARITLLNWTIISVHNLPRLVMILQHFAIWEMHRILTTLIVIKHIIIRIGGGAPMSLS